MNLRNSKLKSSDSGDVVLNMTSMIDVVFLLLAFFVITYKTPEVEGDFDIQMPSDVQSDQLYELDSLTPVTVRLRADASGNLTGIFFGDTALGTDIQKLRQAVYEYIRLAPVDFQTALSGAQTPEFRDDLEIELDFDEKLKYQHVMDTITAVTGYINQENEVVKMVEKIKFKPPKNRPPAK